MVPPLSQFCDLYRSLSERKQLYSGTNYPYTHCSKMAEVIGLVVVCVLCVCVGGGVLALVVNALLTAHMRDGVAFYSACYGTNLCRLQ